MSREHKGTFAPQNKTFINITTTYVTSIGYFTNICIPALLLFSSLLSREAAKQEINSSFFTSNQETNSSKSPSWVTWTIFSVARGQVLVMS